MTPAAPHRPARRGRPRTLTVAAGVVIGLAAAIWLVQYASMARRMVDELHLNDFGKFYYSTAAFLDGRDMYGPSPATEVPVTASVSRQFWNLNPPHFHFLLLPLAPMTPTAAYGIWVLLSLLALAGSFAVLGRTLRLRWTPAGLALAASAVVFASATAATVVTGQVTFLLMVVFTLAWSAAREGRWTRAAWLLGVAASVKPILGVFWLFLLWRGRARAAAVMTVSIVAAVVLGLVVFGRENYASWIRVVGAVDWSWATMNGSLHGLLVRTFAPNDFFVPIVDAPAVVTPLWAAAAVPALGLSVHLLARDASPEATDRAFLGLLLTAQLVSPLGWVYYLWLIAGPAVAVCRSVASRPSAARNALIVLAVPGLVWPFPLAGWLRLEPWVGMTTGSIYSWTTLLLWAAVLVDVGAARAAHSRQPPSGTISLH
jgi:hypothetical protein